MQASQVCSALLCSMPGRGLHHLCWRSSECTRICKPSSMTAFLGPPANSAAYHYRSI